jgi:hypothetical protein
MILSEICRVGENSEVENVPLQIHERKCSLGGGGGGGVDRQLTG